MPKTLSGTIIYIVNDGVVTGGEWVALLQLRKRRELPRDEKQEYEHDIRTFHLYRK